MLLEYYIIHVTICGVRACLVGMEGRQVGRVVDRGETGGAARIRTKWPTYMYISSRARTNTCGCFHVASARRWHGGEGKRNLFQVHAVVSGRLPNTRCPRVGAVESRGDFRGERREKRLATYKRNDRVCR